MKIDGVPEDRPVIAENINEKLSRKRHSMPYNNRLVLQEYQLPLEESGLSALYRRQSMPAAGMPVSTKKRQSRGSIGYIALQELTSILITKTKDTALQERLQSFYDETGKSLRLSEKNRLQNLVIVKFIPKSGYRPEFVFLTGHPTSQS